jgi:hypothetical protein
VTVATVTGGPTAPGGRAAAVRAAAAAARLACAAALTAGCVSQAAGTTAGTTAGHTATAASSATAASVPGGTPAQHQAPAPGAAPASNRAAPTPNGRPATPAQTRAVRTAADTLVAAASSRVGTAMRMASGGTWLTVTGTGGFDYAGRQGELTVVLPRDAIGKEEHKPVTELLTPGALYMKNRGEGVPAGKWVRVDTTRLPDGNLVTGGATEPLMAAELLRGARAVTYVGRETVGGAEVLHLRGTTDIARAAAGTPAADGGPLRAAAKGFTVTRVPFDVWLDAQGRPRRIVQSFTFSTVGSTREPGQNVTVVSTTTYDHFGAPVPVIMPRAADIWTGKIVSAQP